MPRKTTAEMVTADTGTPTTRRAAADLTRARLLDTAVAAFSEAPYEQVSVSAIAERAGVAHGVLFHHYGSKRGIYLEAARKAASDHEAAALRRDPKLSPGAQVRDMYRSHYRYLERNRDLALRLVLIGRNDDHDVWEPFEETRWRTIDWICAVLGLPTGSVAVRLALRAAAGAADEMAVSWLTEHRRELSADILADILIDMTTASLRAVCRLDPALDVEKAVSLLEAPVRPPAS